WMLLGPRGTVPGPGVAEATATAGEEHHLASGGVVGHAHEAPARGRVRWVLLRPRGAVPRPGFLEVHPVRVDATEHHHLVAGGIERGTHTAPGRGRSRRVL